LFADAIHYRNGKSYDLLAFTIMPNHVHMVFSLLPKDDNSVGRLAESTRKVTIHRQFGRDSVPSYRVTQILESLKKYSALRANRLLARTGAFWQQESYDHVIRNGEELERIIWYVLNNPVKAGFVDSWEKWPWTFCKKGLL